MSANHYMTNEQLLNLQFYGTSSEQHHQKQIRSVQILSGFGPLGKNRSAHTHRYPRVCFLQLICRCELQLSSLCCQLQPELSTGLLLLENREWKIGFMLPTRFPLGQKGRMSSCVRALVCVSRVCPQQCNMQLAWRQLWGGGCWGWLCINHLLMEIWCVMSLPAMNNVFHWQEVIIHSIFQRNN